MIIRKPQTAGDWASIFVAASAFFKGLAAYLQGNTENGMTVMAVALLSLVTNSFVNSGYHVEIRKDDPGDLTVPDGITTKLDVSPEITSIRSDFLSE